MLSRHNSDAARRLRRAKSSSSSRLRQPDAERGEHLDPKLARQHALTAASLAYEQTRSAKNDDAQKPRASDEEPRTLNRRQSIRFAGPNAVPVRHRPITRREAIPWSGPPVECRSAPPSGSPFLRRTQSSLTALPAIGSPYRTPSPPHRKLRKARSMLSPHKSPSLISSNTTSVSYLKRSTRSGNSEQDDEQPLPNRPLKPNPHPYLSKQDQDAALELARSQYLAQVASPNVTHLGLGKRSVSQKFFRKTVRTSSATSYGPAIASSTGAEATARKASGGRTQLLSFGLMDKLKKVFHKTTDPRTSLPTQHVDSQRPHFGDYLTASPRGADMAVPDDDRSGRLGSCSSPIQQAPLAMQSHHLTNSDGIGGIAGQGAMVTRSRVTSWSDSDAANTMQKMDADGRTRLSVIQENWGPYGCAASGGAGGETLKQSYAAFMRPLRSSSGNSTNPIDNFDSRRVFSALQKKIDENKRVWGQKKLDYSFGGHRRLSRKISGWSFGRSSIGAGQNAAGTIRIVSDKPSEQLPYPRAIRLSQSMNLSRLSSEWTDDIPTPESSKGNAGLIPESVDTKSLKYPQVADRNEVPARSPRKPLREAKSLFFPSATGLVSKQLSPYRQALRGSSEEDASEEIEQHIPYHGKSRFTGLGVDGGQDSMPTTGESSDSSSVYSRATDDTPKASRTLERTESGVELGTAVIVNSTPFIGMRMGQVDKSSAEQVPSWIKSSGEWKGWVASEIATLDNTFRDDVHTHRSFSTTSTSHRRERAQICGDERDLGDSADPAFKRHQPLGAIQPNGAPRTAHNGQGSSQMHEGNPLRFPLLERRPSPANVMGRQTWTSRARAASTDQTDTNNENVRYGYCDFTKPYGAPGKKSASPLPSEDSPFDAASSSNSNLPAEDATGTHRRPVTQAQSRRSPERTARLRRMKGKGGQEAAGRARLQQATPAGNAGAGAAAASDHPTVAEGSRDVRGLVEAFLSSRRSDGRSSPAFI